LGLEARHVDLALGGGNFVCDGQSQAVVTKRALADNPGRSRHEVVDMLQGKCGLERACLLPEEEGDITGHADGMAKWLSPTKIAVSRYAGAFRRRILRRLAEAFPDVEAVELPYCPTGRAWRDGWEDAAGIYVNALETAGTVFVPVYGLVADEEALAVYRRHSPKRVVAIETAGVSVAGGSLHCLGWVVGGGDAQGIVGRWALSVPRPNRWRRHWYSYRGLSSLPRVSAPRLFAISSLITSFASGSSAFFRKSSTSLRVALLSFAAL
jgi:hypothetical protein